MKKIMTVLLCSVIGMCSMSSLETTVSAATVKITDVNHDGIEVLLNARKIKFPDAKPYSQDSRVMVPIRFVSEALGAVVKWDGGKEVTIVKNKKTVQLTIGSSVAKVDGKNITFDTTMKIMNQRTYVPLRFVSEALGQAVSWESNWVWIGSKDVPTAEEAGINTEEISKFKNMFGSRDFFIEGTTQASVITTDQLPLKFGDIIVHDLWKVKQTPGDFEGVRVRYSGPTHAATDFNIFYLSNDKKSARSRNDVEELMIKNSDGSTTRTYKIANEKDLDLIGDKNYLNFKIMTAEYIGFRGLNSEHVVLLKNPLK